MTVLENVLLGAHHSHGGRFFQTRRAALGVGRATSGR